MPAEAASGAPPRRAQQRKVQPVAVPQLVASMAAVAAEKPAQAPRPLLGARQETQAMGWRWWVLRSSQPVTMARAWVGVAAVAVAAVAVAAVATAAREEEAPGAPPKRA